MSTTTGTTRTRGGSIDHVNEVRLIGRISGDPQLSEMPSGDPLWSFRLVVERSAGASRPRSGVDTIECAVWSGRMRRSVGSWRDGDHVEVIGGLRRRFYLAGGARVSRYQVEVVGGRLMSRAASG